MRITSRARRSLGLAAVVAAALAASATLVPAALTTATPSGPAVEPPSAAAAMPQADDIQARLGQYTRVALDPDLSSLSEAELRMIPLLIRASEQMDEVFWLQAWGDREELLEGIEDADLRRYVTINKGPWDRLAGWDPFVPGIGPRPGGANLYPHDVTAAEIEAAAADDPELTSLYTLVRRNADGSLRAVPYHRAFAFHVAPAARLLREAAALAPQDDLRRYLELRAAALLDDEYYESDLAWMEMVDNRIELVIGPIETYEDQLLGAKAAYEAYVMVKDLDWSRRLARYAELLPSLQEALPVPPAYRAEEPGSDAQLGAYDLVYAAGDGNAGSKTIAINLPNDERVQLAKGTRRLQIKNAMRAKFDAILVPLAERLLVPEQQEHVTFDAFFANTMFHEVAHGLGIKNTLDGSGTVREALRDQASWMEEGKADVLGLWMITELHGRGELGDVDLRDYYTTFFASIFRSIRFGASSAHGRANLVRFNFFREMDAFTRDGETGRWAVDFEGMEAAMTALSERILRLQGDGDRQGAMELHDQMAVTGPQLEAALRELSEAGIPVDIVYEQGLDRLGL